MELKNSLLGTSCELEIAAETLSKRVTMTIANTQLVREILAGIQPEFA